MHDSDRYGSDEAHGYNREARIESPLKRSVHQNSIKMVAGEGKISTFQFHRRDLLRHFGADKRRDVNTDRNRLR